MGIRGSVSEEDLPLTAVEETRRLKDPDRCFCILERLASTPFEKVRLTRVEGFTLVVDSEGLGGILPRVLRGLEHR
jgi:hypothetical protein